MDSGNDVDLRDQPEVKVECDDQFEASDTFIPELKREPKDGVIEDHETEMLEEKAKNHSPSFEMQITLYNDVTIKKEIAENTIKTEPELRSDPPKSTLKRYSKNSDIVGEINRSKRIRKVSPQNWVKTKVFETPLLATNYVNNLNKWKIITSYNCSAGCKITYRCTAGEYRKNECPAKMYLLYHCESSVVSMYQTDDEHDNHVETKRGLSTSMREVVRQLFCSGIRTPNAIIAGLKNRGLEEPNKAKLKNFLSTIRDKKFDQQIMSPLSMKEIIDWANARMDVPVEEDKPFVLGVEFKVDDEYEQDLNFVVSTKRLLRLVNKSETVQTDATHKLIWQDYSVLIVGSSDMNQVFHPFAVAVCKNETESVFSYIFNCVKDSCYKIYETEWNPKVLLADATSAITNGFKAVFGLSFQRLTCYTQLVKNIDYKLRDIKDKAEIKSDIEFLHLCRNDDTFNVVSELFLKKWREKNDENITVFIEYFESVWLNNNRHWYIGTRNFVPSTNNGLEATNSAIRRAQMLRERLPVGQFLEQLENAVVKKWSNEHDSLNPNYKPFYKKPQYTKQVWRAAYDWAKSDVNIFEDEKENSSVFYIPSSQMEQNVSAEIVRSYEYAQLKWTAFDEYKTECEYCIWKVTVTTSDSDGFLSTCSCPAFAKKYICEHSLGMLIHMGKEKVPNEIKQKRKQGRPPVRRKALLVE